MKIKQITHLGRIFWFTGESWSQDEYEARELSPEQAEKKSKIMLAVLHHQLGSEPCGT